MAALNNRAKKSVGKIEKVGEDLENVETISNLVDDVSNTTSDSGIHAELTRRIETYENRMKELEQEDFNKNADVSPLRKAFYTTGIMVVVTIFSFVVWNNMIHREEQIRQLREHSEQLNEISSHMSNIEGELSKERHIRETSDCRKVSLDNAKILSRNGGLFDIYHNRREIEVFCDLETDGGGWIVFQRRIDGSVDFYRGWDDFVLGFRNKEKEFWLGLETLHKLTSDGRKYELRVDMEDWEGQKRYAKYSLFKIESYAVKYQIGVNGYWGNAGDSFSGTNGKKFTTKNRDLDTHEKVNCAVAHKGAWWYSACHTSNLNAKYYEGEHKSYADGINWFTWRGHHYSLKFTEMKIRPAA
ncbi:microfibril-associated glycoprotein 4-like [Styela clava]